MKEIIIATNNDGKLKEFNEIFNKFNIKCLGLKDINFNDEIIEDKETFKENALIKAKTIFEYCNKPVISDDSGLCVDALNNAPGVYSARYMNLNSSKIDYYKELRVVEDLFEVVALNIYFALQKRINLVPKDADFISEFKGQVKLEQLQIVDRVFNDYKIKELKDLMNLYSFQFLIQKFNSIPYI